MMNELLSWFRCKNVATVVTLCCVIRTTTKGFPSLRKKEMLTTCVAFCLLLSYLRTFRFQQSRPGKKKKKKKNKIKIRVTYFSHSFKFRYVDSGLQEKKMMHNIRQYDVPLHKYMAMMDLQVN